jgi:hypothetical protein
MSTCCKHTFYQGCDVFNREFPLSIIRIMPEQISFSRAKEVLRRERVRTLPK